jgi:hypothetical protein
MVFVLTIGGRAIACLTPTDRKSASHDRSFFDAALLGRRQSVIIAPFDANASISESEWGGNSQCYE